MEPATNGFLEKLKKNIWINGRNLDLHDYEDITFKICLHCYLEQSPFLSLGTRLESLVYISLFVMFYDYLYLPIPKPNPVTRPNVLIIDKPITIRRLLTDCEVNTNFVGWSSKTRANEIRKKYNCFLDINNPQNAHLYWPTYLHKRFKGNSPKAFHLHSLFPVANIYSKEKINLCGSRNYLGKYDNQGPVFYLSSTPDVLYEGLHFDLKLINISKIKNLDNEIDGFTIYYSEDFFEKRISKLASKISRSIAWTPSIMQRAEVNCQLCSHWERSKKQLQEIRIIALDSNFEEIFQQINLSLERINKQAIKAEIRERLLFITRYLISLLFTLITSEDEYSNYAIVVGAPTIADCLEELDDITYFEELNTSSIAAIADLECNLREGFQSRGQGKADKIIELIQNGLSVPTYVVLNGLANVYAFRSLVKRLNLNMDVNVVTAAETPNIPFNSRVIFTACNTQKMIKAISNSKFRNILVVAYKEELNILFNSLNYAISTVNLVLSKRRRQWLNRVVNEIDFEKIDVGCESLWSDLRKSLLDVLKSDCNFNFDFQLPDPEEKSSNVSLTEELQNSNYDGEQNQQMFYECTLVIFDDDTRVYLPDISYIEILDEKLKDKVKAANLKPGYIILFINGSIRNTLYSLILESIEDHPLLTEKVKFIKLWQNSVQNNFIHSGLRYTDFLDKLQLLGSSRESTAACRGWVTGEVMGPSDPEDILRVGQVLNDEALITNWQKIGESLEFIRQLRRSLAKKLNYWIKNSEIPQNDEIFSGLGLAVEDFTEAISFHKIRSIHTSHGQIPRRLVGVIHKLGDRRFLNVK